MQPAAKSQTRQDGMLHYFKICLSEKNPTNQVQQHPHLQIEMHPLVVLPQARRRGWGGALREPGVDGEDHGWRGAAAEATGSTYGSALPHFATIPAQTWPTTPPARCFHQTRNCHSTTSVTPLRPN